jgi:hypothetical protein
MNQSVTKLFEHNPDRDIHPELLPLWRASRVESLPGDGSWIYTKNPEDEDWPRIQQMLLYAVKTQGGPTAKMKFSPLPLIAHQMWGVHLIHNFPDLENFGLNREYEELMFAAHDCGEDDRDLFAKQGKIYTARDAEMVIATIGRILDDPRRYVSMRGEQDYITDAADMIGEERIPAQKAKSFVNGICVIGPGPQLRRAIDKRAQVMHDAWSRIEGYLRDDQLASQIKKAIERIYVLDLPIIKANPWFCAGYHQDLYFLEGELRLMSSSPNRRRTSITRSEMPSA